MRMDRLANVSGLTTHFNCETDLADEIASLHPDDASADESTCFLIEYQLGKSLIAPVCDRAARGCPWKDSLAELDTLRLALIFGLTRPCELGIGVGHRRYLTRVKIRVFS